MRPGRVSPGQESSLPEKQELHQPSRAERHSQENRAGPQEGGDDLGLPGTLREQLHTEESALSSLKDCSAHSWTRAQLGGAQAVARQRGLPGQSANPTAQAREHRVPVTQPRIQLPPHDRQRTGGPRTARTLLPQAEQISGHTPGASRPLQMESPGVTAGAESRAPELAPPLRLFLLGPQGVNNPH